MAPPKLPPGFRFHPTDAELVAYYLRRKVHGRAMEYDVIAEVDLYKCEPWDLPDKSLIWSPDPEWYFFSARDRKYANGLRTNRATEAGYWKATGKDRAVKTGGRTVGMKKTLVFYGGRAPRGERTDWVMHEYRLEDGNAGKAKSEAIQDAYVLCRVFKKNGIGPSNLESSTNLDAEDEVVATTTEEGQVADERQTASESHVIPFLSDSIKKEEELSWVETTENMAHSTAVEQSQSLEAPVTCNFEKASDSEMSSILKLLNDPSQSLNTCITASGSLSQLEKPNSVLELEGPIDRMTAQDTAFWLDTPLLSGDTNASVFNYLDLSSYYSLEEADMLDDLCKSTLYSEGSKQIGQHVAENCTESRSLVQNLMLPQTQSVNMYEIGGISEYMLKDQPSKNLNGTEEMSEEELLEEMFQLITQSNREDRHPVPEKMSPADVGFEDFFCDVLVSPNADDWIQSESSNETSMLSSEAMAAVEPTAPFKNSLDEPNMLPSDVIPCSEGQFLRSSLLTQKLRRVLDKHGHAASSSTLLTPTEVQVSHLEDSMVKPSGAVSWFSQLLDSVPALPASASELPENHQKLQSDAKDLHMSILGQNYTFMLTTALGTCLKSVSSRCSHEILSRVWRSSASKGLQPQNSTPKKTILSVRASTGHSTDKTHCFGRDRNGCFSVLFFVGALSAVCWFLILRVLWRLAGHMGSVLK